MIRDLDDTVKAFIEQAAKPGSDLAQAEISFDLPDSTWRKNVKENGHTINCYLYDVQENTQLRTHEPLIQRGGSDERERAVRRRPPARVDCSYRLTAWSPADREAVLEEHRLLGQVLKVLLKNRTIPQEVLQGDLADQIPPYPTVIASPNGLGNRTEFWAALDHPVKPSLSYVVTLAIMLDEGDWVDMASGFTFKGEPKERKEIYRMNKPQADDASEDATDPSSTGQPKRHRPRS